MSAKPRTELIDETRQDVASARFGDALRKLSAALGQSSDDGELRFHRACTLLDWGRFREAHAEFLRARQTGFTGLSLDLNLALTCLQSGALDEAREHAQRAVRADVRSADAQYGFGSILAAQNEHAAAVACFRNAVDLAPESLQAHVALSSALLAVGKLEDAETAARGAIAVDGDAADAWGALALALGARGPTDECLAAHRRALAADERRGGAAEAFANLGASLIEAGRVHEASDLFERHLPEHPNPQAQAHYGFARMTLGDLQTGFAHYEFRWIQEPLLSARPRYPIPVWNGQALAGKTILLWAEQGLGDVIQFARYAGEFRQRGARVLLQVLPALESIGAWFDNVDRAFARGEAFTAFDFHLPLMSAPHALGNDIDSIPAKVPYLRCPDEQRTRHSARLASGTSPKVGLVWSGNPKHRRDSFRSCPLHVLQPLLSVRDVRFFSLQKDIRDADRVHLLANPALTDLSPELQDFRDTATIVDQLDLVICVDTGIAHLAGAMGKAVWLMLPRNADFRWLTERDNSPWYPTMRLFRQEVQGDWTPVVARLAAALTTLAEDVGQHRFPRAAEAAEKRTGNASIPGVSASLSQVTETRHGIFQFWPQAPDVARSLVELGEFREADLDLIRTLVSPGFHAIEVDADVGVHTVPIARYAGGSGHVIAYESRRDLQRLLRQNVHTNGVTGVVTVMRGSPCGTRLEDPAPSSVEFDRHVLDDLDLGRLDLVISSCNAATTAVIEGANGTLWRLRPVVLVRIDGAQFEGPVVAALGACGYRVFRITRLWANATNFNRREFGLYSSHSCVTVVAIPEESRKIFDFPNAEELTPAVFSNRESVAALGSSIPDSGGTPAKEGVVKRLLRRLAWRRDMAQTRAPKSVHESSIEIGPQRELAAQYFRSGRYGLAVDILQRIVDTSHATAADHGRLGWALLNESDLAGATRWFQRSLDSSPHHADNWYGLASAMQRAGDSAGALAGFRRAVELQPESADFAQAMAECLLVAGLLDEASATAARAEGIAPDRASLALLRGQLAFQTDRLAEALGHFSRAMALEKRHGMRATAFVNVAIVLVEMGRNADAITLLTVHLRSAPDPYGFYMLSLAFLRAGRYAEGWRFHEFRWLAPRFLAQRPRFDRPLWQGQDVAGRTVLLVSEQGFGDTIQFIRYAKDAKARGARVEAKVHVGLESIVARVDGIDRVLGRTEAPANFDFFVPLMSLPKALEPFTTACETLPYISSLGDRRDLVEARLADDHRLRVGLCWAGNPAHDRDRLRSIPFANFARFAALSDVHFVSLQGSRPNGSGNDAAWLDCSLGPFDDFELTAAVIDALDLVVTVDTAVAHLAGALGKDVWILLPHVADFRWLEGRSDTPWYPTAILLRQTERGDWTAVLDDVARRLTARASEPSRRTPAHRVLPAVPSPSTGETQPVADGTEGLADIGYTRYGFIQYLHSAESSATAIRSLGEWREAELRFLARFAKTDAVVVEVGSVFGMHAVALARMVGPTGRVWLLEPRAIVRDLLRSNVSVSGLSQVTFADTAENGVDQLDLQALDLLKICRIDLLAATLSGSMQTVFRLGVPVFVQLAESSETGHTVSLLRGAGLHCFAVVTPRVDMQDFNRSGAERDSATWENSVLALPASRLGKGLEAGLAALG